MVIKVGSGEIDDLSTLSVLDEESLLRELRARYKKGIIYTYIGDVLIAINPFKQLNIYEKQVCFIEQEQKEKHLINKKKKTLF
ncbi:unnamed protein product [Rotaria sp. Silwood2]|nr:unnamed protein product [Rotaria sp. Silwood2]